MARNLDYGIHSRPVSTLVEAIAHAEALRLIGRGNLDSISLSDFDPGVRQRLEAREFNLSDVIDQINEKIRQQKAREKIIESWNQQGGPSSPLGLPLDDRFKLVVKDGKYLVPFRGGAISSTGSINTLNNELGSPCRLTFEGLILHSRQETSPDELYGSVGFKIPSMLMGDKVMVGTFNIPEVSLGGKNARNTRVYQTSHEIYRGPPVGLQLLVSLAEHDSGDREAVRGKVKAIIEKAASTAGALMGPGTAGTILSEAGRANEQQSQDTFSDWVKDAASSVITDLFGLADDIYTPAGISILPEEMATPPQPVTAGHQLDNKTITYTHKLDLSGRDDDGAVGNCTAYFRLWR